jgi:sugar phosphate isomerase/epimerase
MSELSVLVTSLPTAPEIALAELARLGFRHVDLVGKAHRLESERQALADSGLIVDCVALGRDLPEGCKLDASDITMRRRGVDEVQQQIAEAAQIGARVGYLVPCKDSADLAAFADSCRNLAEFARARMVQLCVEHFPGSALPTAAAALQWLNDAGLENVKLVLDLGHCLISREDPSAVVAQAGPRLGYVQLDDNDGVNDVHWPLLTGALTEAILASLLHRLRGFHGGIALELNGKLADPVANLLSSKRIVEAMWR